MSRTFDAAVLHDYFVDRLVHTGSVATLTKGIDRKAARGGGGIHGVVQEDVSGGNAVNLARAMSRLGLKVLLITHSDGAHRALLEEAFEGLDAEVRVKPVPPGLTVAVEGQVNVMLGDCRGAARFGPSRLDEDDWAALGASEVVCCVNWAANELGTKLLKSLRRRLGESQTIFFDPADFRDRAAQFGELLEEASRRPILDWVSMNEEEAKAAARLLGLEAKGLDEVCRELAAKLGVTFDLHSLARSFTSDGGAVAVSRCFKVRPRRLTGAGDAWDAAAIYGRLKGMWGVERLRFANAAASLFLERKEQLPASLEEVLARLE